MTAKTAKTLLITGASGGIGLEACKVILRTQKVARKSISWSIILAQRDPQSVKAIRAQSQLESLAQASESCITPYKCDFTSFESVRKFAKEIGTQRIDVMILNAGMVANSYQQTQDGNDMNYQVNHLAQFLLLQMLQENVKDLVLFISSSLHTKANAQQTLSSLSPRREKGAVQTTEDRYRGLTMYRQSKLLSAGCAPIWHTHMAPKKVRVVSLCPGFVPSSDLSRDNSALMRYGMSYVLHYMPFARTLTQAGEAVAAVALADEYAHLDSVLLSSELKNTRFHEVVYDQEFGNQVWAWSETRTKQMT